jgi:hypothetical protein
LIKNALCKKFILNQAIEILNKFNQISLEMIFRILISEEIVKKLMNIINGIRNFLGMMKFKGQTKKYLEMKNLEKIKSK